MSTPFKHSKQPNKHTTNSFRVQVKAPTFLLSNNQNQSSMLIKAFVDDLTYTSILPNDCISTPLELPFSQIAVQEGVRSLPHSSILPNESSKFETDSKLGTKQEQTNKCQARRLWDKQFVQESPHRTKSLIFQPPHSSHSFVQSLTLLFVYSTISSATQTHKEQTVESPQRNNESSLPRLKSSFLHVLTTTFVRSSHIWFSQINCCLKKTQ